MYDTILVPHAGTPGGDNALKHAINIAKPNQSTIVILHVIEDMPHVPILALHGSQMREVKKQLREITSSIKEKMTKEMSKRAKLCAREGVSSHVKITDGDPFEEIRKMTHDKKINLIVMAKRRKLRGIKRLLKLGSVSRKVLESVSCPILMIDEEK